MDTTKEQARILVLGIGNVLMGDEGVGVHAVRRIAELKLPEGTECLDGGTGSLVLLEPMQSASKVILIDATIDGAEPGTVRRLEPRFSRDYPRTLTAHDIGLKDLLDALYLLGAAPKVTLFAVSIAAIQEIGTDLSPAIAHSVDRIATLVLAELAGTLQTAA
jgi:hydrogenase maturation protease